MRWTSRVAGALAFVWLIYLASPFVALHSLGRALQDQDVAAIGERVNLRAIRLSLLKQFLNAYVDEAGGRDLGRGQRQLAVEAAMGMIEPIVAQLITSEAIIDVLREGRVRIKLSSEERSSGPSPGTPAADRPAANAIEIPSGTASLTNALRVRSLASAWRLFLSSELRGFRNIVVSLPSRSPPEQQFRLRLRLVRATWRLVSLELPEDIVKRLVRALPKVPARYGDLAPGRVEIASAP